MKKLSLIAAAIIMAGTSASANAWSGNNWCNDFLGDVFGAGAFDFSLNMHARGDGYGRGARYDNAYYGYAPYHSPAMTEEQRTALIEQQKAFAEQQQKAFEEAVAAQRKYAEQFNADPTAATEAEHKATQAQMEARRKVTMERKLFKMPAREI